MKINEFNNAFQTEQQYFQYITNLKEVKCIQNRHGTPLTDVAKELVVTLKNRLNNGGQNSNCLSTKFMAECIVKMDKCIFHIWMLKNKEEPWWIKHWLLEFLKNANNKNLLKFARKHISCQCYAHTDLLKRISQFQINFS